MKSREENGGRTAEGGEPGGEKRHLEARVADFGPAVPAVQLGHRVRVLDTGHALHGDEEPNGAVQEVGVPAIAAITAARERGH